MFVHVCKSKRKDADGMICHDELIGKAKKKTAGATSTRRKFFDFPDFWLNNPGTYYWQAYRSCVRRRPGRLQGGGPRREVQGGLM